MFTNSRLIALMAIATGLALVLGGCGGGGAGEIDGPGTVGTASVTGTVYAPEAAVTTAQAATDASVPNCPVAVCTEPGGQRLATGTTDGAGAYAFHGLQAGETVVVEARVHGSEPLLTRLRLRDGSCQADVTEGTTLAAICARHAYGAVGDAALADEVAQQCLQYQTQNGYQSGQGGRPDFSDAGAVDESASALLAATAARALEQARATRSEADCERAVRMMMAHLRERDDSGLRWTTQLVTRIATALRQGAVGEEDVAPVLSRIMNREVTAEQVQRALRYLWQRLGMGEPNRDPELLEVVAAMTCACGDQQMLRLRTQDQTRALVEGLIAPE